jgi:hypothetical protein
MPRRRSRRPRCPQSSHSGRGSTLSDGAAASASQLPSSFSLAAGQSAARCHGSPAHRQCCRGSPA